MNKVSRPRRNCGDCNVCCGGWLRIKILDVEPGHPCKHLTQTGCSIYKDRPVDPCQKFFCSWAAEDSPLPDEMQPHLSGAIVMFGALKWQNIHLDHVIPVGEEIPEKTMKWLMEFARKYNRPTIYSKNVIKNGVYSKETMMLVYTGEPLRSQITNWLQAGNSFF